MCKYNFRRLPAQYGADLYSLPPCSYTEAIHVLYSSNCFDFKDPYGLRYFLQSILPRRIDTIRSVRMYYQAANIYEGYDVLWEALLSIPGLREVRVMLSTPFFVSPGREFWTAREGKWVAPLKHLKGLQVFEVYFPMIRAQPLPKSVDVGSCQLYVANEYGGNLYPGFVVAIN